MGFVQLGIISAMWFFLSKLHFKTAEHRDAKGNREYTSYDALASKYLWAGFRGLILSC